MSSLAPAGPRELPADQVASDERQTSKIAAHEDAAHEKRNWVRLTFDCNNHCVFCLDTLAHDGNMRDREEVKRQILEGRKAGATRLILSGGEPTMHPHYVDFIKLGRLAGYRKIQTVTNGRQFSYPDFLERCLSAGLNEITFSLHGPNAKVHDALVGVKGAFEQETRALKMALADRRTVVNVDIVINRANVKHLPAMLELFYSWGVREFDLLQVIPFGNAFREGRDILFYDLEEARPYLQEAFAWTRRPDVHVWLNRFPPPHMEGFEHLIQDPYKLNDEVRGRKEEFARLLDEGVDLDCRDPNRCRYCYLQNLCDTLYDVRDRVARGAYSALRIDTEAEGRQDVVFGGDPASVRRAQREEEAWEASQAPQKEYERTQGGRKKLPMYVPPAGKHPLLPRPGSLEALAADLDAAELHVRSTDVGLAAQTAARFERTERLLLELDDYTGLAEQLDAEGRLAGKKVFRAVAATSAQAEQLLALPHEFEVLVQLSRDTAPWLLALAQVPARLALSQPTHDKLTESAARDVDLADFFRAFTHDVPVEGLPACVSGRPPRQAPPTLDTAMMTPEGRLEIFRYTRRFTKEHYRTKALRCRGCVHDASCAGMHINYVRAHGYGIMQPVTASSRGPDEPGR